jgi:hypothetical protein
MNGDAHCSFSFGAKYTKFAFHQVNGRLEDASSNKKYRPAHSALHQPSIQYGTDVVAAHSTDFFNGVGHT